MKKGRRMATERQIAFANSISKGLGLDIEFGKSDSFYEVDKFISENEPLFANKKRLDRKATVRQIDFANAISEKCNLGVVFDATSGYMETTEFISAYQEEYTRMLRRESLVSRIESREEKPEPKYLSAECQLFICDNLHKKHGVYAFLGENDIVLYIGKSVDLSQRIQSSYGERKNYAEIKRIMYYIDENMANVNILEILLIAENNPVLNRESKTADVPDKFFSNLIIQKDFCELPYFS